MTTKEAISFRFDKVTVTTEVSGSNEVFHYFQKTINGVPLMIDVDKNGNWYGTIFDMGVKFYPADLFRDIVNAVEKGEWDAQV
jgi:hypothetical protein